MKAFLNDRPWLLLLWTFLIALLAPVFWAAIRDCEPTSQASGESVIDARRYANLQAALDALPPGGGIVTLPPGEHILTKPLEVTRGNVRIQGCGPATHLVNQNKEGQPALILRPPERPASNQEMNGPRIWRTHVADFRISGNPQSGDGLLVVGVNELYVHDLFIDHNGGHGICLADCYENPRITDCNITYNGGAGIHLKSKSWNPVITSNHFEENRDGVEALRIFNICMTGNSFDDHLRHGIIVEDSWGGIVVGNVLEQCAGGVFELDRVHPSFLEKAPGVAHRLGGRHLIGKKGHVADQVGEARSAGHRLAVMEHVLHGDRKGVFVPQHDHGERIAHQDRIDARPIQDQGRRIVVGGQHGDRFAAGFLVGQGADGDSLARRLGGTHGSLLLSSKMPALGPENAGLGSKCAVSVGFRSERQALLYARRTRERNRALRPARPARARAGLAHVIY